MKTLLSKLSAVTIAGLFAASAGAAPVPITPCPTTSSTPHDLTSIGAVYQDANAIFFIPTSDPSSGTGVIESFVRIQSNTDCESGYNTSDRPLQLDENSSPIFTHDLLLSSIPIVTVDGIEYREFILDINQTGSDPLLSLVQVRLYSGADQATNTAAGDFDGVNLGTLTPIYTMNAGGNTDFINLDYSLYGGSGAGIDMVLLVRNSLFGTGPNVYLYSLFGQPNNANDGFEEWAYIARGTTVCPPGNFICTPQQVPEPNVLALLAIGLLGLFGFARGLRRA